MTQVPVQTAQQVATRGDWRVSAPSRPHTAVGKAGSEGQRSRKDGRMIPLLPGRGDGTGVPVGTDTKVFTLCLPLPGRIG